MLARVAAVAASRNPQRQLRLHEGPVHASADPYSEVIPKHRLQFVLRARPRWSGSTCEHFRSMNMYSMRAMPTYNFRLRGRTFRFWVFDTSIGVAATGPTSADGTKKGAKPPKSKGRAAEPGQENGKPPSHNRGQAMPPSGSASGSAGDLEGALLKALSSGPDACVGDTWAFAEQLACPHERLVGVLKSLERDEIVTPALLETKFWVLAANGEEALQNGSPECRVMACVPEGDAGIAQDALGSSLDEEIVKLGMIQCMKNKWLARGAGGVLTRNTAGEMEDSMRALLLKLKEGGFGEGVVGNKEAKELKRRKMASLVTRKSFKITRGPHYVVERVKKTADLTSAMLVSGEWKKTTFKEYNFKSLGVPAAGGNLHPLLKVRAEFRNILMQMGFEEMPTNRWVESSFWNFDSLFQPQSHPARDAHDTFFIKDPAAAQSVPEEYLETVKETHEKGGFGSVGYGYDWKREEAMKNLLRTHTTAISSQMLHKLANQEGGFKPKRYFSIDRVFRNETMDATHLCEFHQVEGFVADRNLCLGDLIGTIKTFFEKIGITQIRFKPAYNPYTEPSMEIFGYHPDLGKWTEIGNSGMFRPEMLRPMGLPEDVRVIAWGLSLERPTMIKYRISNIRELFGHKADLGRTKRAPICRFDI